jgi:hypothetical protein
MSGSLLLERLSFYYCGLRGAAGATPQMTIRGTTPVIVADQHRFARFDVRGRQK